VSSGWNRYPVQYPFDSRVTLNSRFNLLKNHEISNNTPLYSISTRLVGHPEVGAWPTRHTRITGYLLGYPVLLIVKNPITFCESIVNSCVLSQVKLSAIQALRFHESSPTVTTATVWVWLTANHFSVKFWLTVACVAFDLFLNLPVKMSYVIHLYHCVVLPSLTLLMLIVCLASTKYLRVWPAGFSSEGRAKFLMFSSVQFIL